MVDVDRHGRPAGDMIPCPMCKHPSKFFAGSLVYMERLQCIAVIGHCCVEPKHQKAAQEEYNARLKRRPDEDALLHELPSIGDDALIAIGDTGEGAGS